MAIFLIIGTFLTSAKAAGAKMMYITIGAWGKSLVARIMPALKPMKAKVITMRLMTAGRPLVQFP